MASPVLRCLENAGGWLHEAAPKGRSATPIPADAQVGLMHGHCGCVWGAAGCGGQGSQTGAPDP